MTPERRVPRKLPSRFEEEMKANALRIAPLVSAAALWDRVLSAEDRRRLGDDFEAAYRMHRTAGMWAYLRGVSRPRAVVDVAYALGFATLHTRTWLLRELGEVHDSEEDALCAAVAGGGLVLRERPREAYWAGQEIPLNWEQRSALWNYFWCLCQCAKTGRELDYTQLGEEVRPDAAVKQKSRLLRTPGFPAELGARIQRAGRGAQRLDVPAPQIRLFQVESQDVFREWTG